MLAELTPLEKIIHLIRDSGIQFMDFGIRLDPENLRSGYFSKMANNGLARLLYDYDAKEYFHLEVANKEGQNPERKVLFVNTDDSLVLRISQSLEVLNAVWLPLPYFRFKEPCYFDEGPANWSRIRIVKLDSPDTDGNTHRLTVALDTKIMERIDGSAYLAPNLEDIEGKSQFRLACHHFQMRWFLDQEWVRDWLEEVFRDASQDRKRETVDEDVEELRHIAHYLNLLSLLAAPEVEENRRSSDKVFLELPHLHLAANLRNSSSQEQQNNDKISQAQPVHVDMVLDVGNSRTCGVLIEDQGQAGDGLKHNYALQMRDLHNPECVYSKPFDSRVEFAQMTFGKENFSKFSGRHDAFQWPTIARVGEEAARLCARRLGSEGSTGLSSPKRYLWDDNRYVPGWRFNSAFGKSEGSEAMATAAPFSTRITDKGLVFYAVRDEFDRLPAFSPEYTRSSLMTFMLAEVITQALSQINSPAQRTRMGHSSRPRVLRSVTLTVPPGLAQVERSILQTRLQHAIALVWQAMGWDEGLENPYDKNGKSKTHLQYRVPHIKVEWDEATCGQLVYLYTEICENFGGHPEEFFETLVRPDKNESDRITLASIDIGGGTSDIVINDYGRDEFAGGNVAIVPRQRFRDSFRIAGDDVLLDIINIYILPYVEKSLTKANVKESGALLSKLCGDESISAQDKVLRQQLNLQVFTPLGLEILRRYEKFSIENPPEPEILTFGQLLNKNVSPRVKEYIASAVRRVSETQNFDINQVELELDLVALHRDFLEGRINLTKTLDSLAEVLAQYPCDALLLTGRPSMLPGVLTCLQRKVAVLPGRIVSMHGYTTNGWYPFNEGGKINDPKTTAAVGAMVALLSEKRKLANFYLSVERMQPYSTMRHIGVIDKNNLIKNDDLLYRDVVRTDDKDREYLELYEPGTDAPTLRIQGKTRLGFRQLNVERWVAAPLYLLELTDKAVARLQHANVKEGTGEKHLIIRFNVAEEDLESTGILAEKLELDERIDSNTDEEFSKKDVRLQLYTMASAEGGASTYWLDSGSVKQ